MYLEYFFKIHLIDASENITTDGLALTLHYIYIYLMPNFSEVLEHFLALFKIKYLNSVFFIRY